MYMSMSRNVVSIAGVLLVWALLWLDGAVGFSYSSSSSRGRRSNVISLLRSPSLTDRLLHDYSSHMVGGDTRYYADRIRRRYNHRRASAVLFLQSQHDSDASPTPDDIDAMDDDDDDRRVQKRNQELEQRVQALSLPQLLAALNRRDIRYAPMASLPELQQLLIQAALQQPKQQKEATRRRTNHRTTNEVIWDVEPIPVEPPFIRRDDSPKNNVPPAKDANRRTRSTSTSEPNQSQQQQQQKRRRGQGRRRNRSNNDDFEEDLDAILWRDWVKPWGETLEKVGGVAVQTTRQVVRQGQRKLEELLIDEDEDGVRNVPFEYVTRDTTRPRPRRRRRPTSVPKRPSPTTKGGNRDPMNQVPVDMSLGIDNRNMTRTLLPPISKDAYFPGTVVDAYSPNTPRSSSSSTSTTNNRKVGTQDSTPQQSRAGENKGPAVPENHMPQNSVPQPPRPQKRREPRSSGRTTPKRSYSVYANSEGRVPIDRKEDDFLDQIGETVTNIADELFFNALDDTDTYSDDEEEEDGTEGNARTKDGAKKSGKRRYWRDRLEERLDYALGIHEDGTLYNKWQDRMEQEGATEPNDDDDGNDPLSIMTGRSPRQHLGYRSKKKRDKPFWEQEGNLFAILFGNSNASEKKLSFSKRFSRKRLGHTNFMTSLLQTLFSTAATMTSYTFQWASVRGALPQPIVAFGVATAAVLARPRQRLATVILTLVAFRTFAELLHATIYEDDNHNDWNDEALYDSDDKPAPKPKHSRRPLNSTKKKNTTPNKENVDDHNRDDEL